MTDIKDLRRELPRLPSRTVGAIDDLTPHLRRFTLVGDELDGLVIDEPAASVRLLLPSPGTDELVMPDWTGNEFLLPDGRRPLIRTFTLATCVNANWTSTSSSTATSGRPAGRSEPPSVTRWRCPVRAAATRSTRPPIRC